MFFYQVYTKKKRLMFIFSTQNKMTKTKTVSTVKKKIVFLNIQIKIQEEKSRFLFIYSKLPPVLSLQLGYSL